MSIFFEILVRIASYGPKIDQSHGENGLSHIIKNVTPSSTYRKLKYKKGLKSKSRINAN